MLYAYEIFIFNSIIKSFAFLLQLLTKFIVGDFGAEYASV